MYFSLFRPSWELLVSTRSDLISCQPLFRTENLPHYHPNQAASRAAAAAAAQSPVRARTVSDDSLTIFIVIMALYSSILMLRITEPCLLSPARCPGTPSGRSSARASSSSSDSSGGGAARIPRACPVAGVQKMCAVCSKQEHYCANVMNSPLAFLFMQRADPRLMGLSPASNGNEADGDRNRDRDTRMAT